MQQLFSFFSLESIFISLLDINISALKAGWVTMSFMVVLAVMNSVLRCSFDIFERMTNTYAMGQQLLDVYRLQAFSSLYASFDINAKYSSSSLHKQ